MSPKTKSLVLAILLLLGFAGLIALPLFLISK